MPSTLLSRHSTLAPAPSRDFGRAVSRVLSAPPFLRKSEGEDHLSQQPIPGTHPAPKSGAGTGRSAVPYLALHPMGFSVPPRLRLERWALTPPFHPYPAPLEPNDGPKNGWAVCFLWHCPSAAPFGLASRMHPEAGLPAKVPAGYAASRPMVLGLSSPGSRRERSSALPKSATIYPAEVQSTIAKSISAV